nr:pyruvate kinase isozyme G, chloroplastic [Ipomoea batatas]
MQVMNNPVTSDAYRVWYHIHGKLFIGNPEHRQDQGYVQCGASLIEAPRHLPCSSLGVSDTMPQANLVEGTHRQRSKRSGMMSLAVKSKTGDLVRCEVIDGGELKSIRHLNVRGKSATLPLITEKDWEDIKFGVENQVDFYAISFVKDADVENQLLSFMIIAFSILRPL